MNWKMVVTFHVDQGGNPFVRPVGLDRSDNRLRFAASIKGLKPFGLWPDEVPVLYWATVNGTRWPGFGPIVGDVVAMEVIG